MDKTEMLNYNILQQVKNGAKIIFVSGASSSGKTFIAENLKNMLAENNISSAVVSTDAFYKNNSRIILEQYFENHFNFFDNETFNKVLKIIDKHILNKTFSEQFDSKNCLKIYADLKNEVGQEIARNIVHILNSGINKIDFDNPNAVNLKKCATFCNIFASNQFKSVIIPQRNFTYSRIDYKKENSVSVDKNSVLIVEGIYALNNELIKNLNNHIKTYKIFIDCDFNTLLVRRFNRDINSKRSSMSKDIVIENFLSSTMPGYIKHTYPNRQNADFIFDNSYTDNERNSNFESQQIKFVVKNIDLTNYQKINSVMQRDFYLNPSFIENTNEVVRIREENGKVKNITHKSEQNNSKSWLNRPEQKFNLQDIQNPNLRNSISICSMFINAGYSFAGSVKKNRINYKFKDVNFCLDTFNDGSQILEIKTGSKENINELIKNLNLKIIQPHSYYSTNFINKGVENEIKVKLNKLPDCCKTFNRIEQTYLTPSLAKLMLSNYFNFSLEDFNEIRIRKENFDYYLTLKSSSLNNRKEKEFLISKTFAKQLLKFKNGKTIVKNRYKIIENSNYKLEVDNFVNLEVPLVLAEVEYANGTEKTANLFLRKFVDYKLIEQDVTNNIAYKNSHLSEIVKDKEYEQKQNWNKG